MKRCPKCNHELNDSFTFCTDCGEAIAAPLSRSEQEPTLVMSGPAMAAREELAIETAKQKLRDSLYGRFKFSPLVRVHRLKEDPWLEKDYQWTLNGADENGARFQCNSTNVSFTLPLDRLREFFQEDVGFGSDPRQGRFLLNCRIWIEGGILRMLPAGPNVIEETPIFDDGGERPIENVLSADPLIDLNGKFPSHGLAADAIYRYGANLVRSYIDALRRLRDTTPGDEFIPEGFVISFNAIISTLCDATALKSENLKITPDELERKGLLLSRFCKRERLISKVTFALQFFRQCE